MYYAVREIIPGHGRSHHRDGLAEWRTVPLTVRLRDDLGCGHGVGSNEYNPRPIERGCNEILYGIEMRNDPD
jgi:hypothetical protein